MNSLRGRLLISASLVSVLFLSLIGVTLDQAYQQSLLHAKRASLRAIINDLLRVADPEKSNILNFPGDQLERRFMTPNSGLYGAVVSSDARVIWQSPSMLGLEDKFVDHIPAGKIQFIKVANNKPLFIMRMGVIWEGKEAGDQSYTFNVAQETSLYDRQVHEFRTDLWLGFLGMVIILAIVQWGVLRWGLSPLKRVTKDLRRIESGEQALLEGDYPLELTGLTENLNTLIAHERLRHKRYKNAMADLAHSLKTPLSVLRGAVSTEQDLSQISSTVLEQVDRLDQIVRYQLQRAATSGKATFAKPIKILPIVNKINSALAKVYADKNIDFQLDIAEQSMFYGEENDLLELLGNTLDNACKWCEQVVIVRAFMCKEDEQFGLALIICDDGPGMPEDEISRLLKRGERADSNKSGHGIGLAVVNEIVMAYNGHLTITKAVIGGAKLGIFLPK